MALHHCILKCIVVQTPILNNTKTPTKLFGARTTKYSVFNGVFMRRGGPEPLPEPKILFL